MGHPKDTRFLSSHSFLSSGVSICRNGINMGILGISTIPSVTAMSWIMKRLWNFYRVVRKRPMWKGLSP